MNSLDYAADFLKMPFCTPMRRMLVTTDAMDCTFKLLTAQANCTSKCSSIAYSLSPQVYNISSLKKKKKKNIGFGVCGTSQTTSGLTTVSQVTTTDIAELS